ncbi:MFS transporter [Vibrio sp. PP-XX7]
MIVTIANVSPPTIAGNLGVSANQGTWVITSFTMSNAIGLALTGWLSRRVGDVRLYVGALVLFSVMSLMRSISQSMSELVIFRTLRDCLQRRFFRLSQVLLLLMLPERKTEYGSINRLGLWPLWARLSVRLWGDG